MIESLNCPVFSRERLSARSVGFHQDGTTPIHEHSPGGSPRVTVV
jgi:hypothetical protein